MDASPPARLTLRTALLVVAVGVCACAPADIAPGPQPGATDRQAGAQRDADALPGDAESVAAPRGPGSPADEPPPPIPRILWPRGWRLVESGSFGGAEDPVVWYRLEGPAGAPGEAASALLGALEPHAGPGGSGHVSAPAGGGEAVAQFDGPHKRAGLLVRRDGSVLSARVMLHPPRP